MTDQRTKRKANTQRKLENQTEVVEGRVEGMQRDLRRVAVAVAIRRLQERGGHTTDWAKQLLANAFGHDEAAIVDTWLRYEGFPRRADGLKRVTQLTGMGQHQLIPGYKEARHWVVSELKLNPDTIRRNRAQMLKNAGVDE